MADIVVGIDSSVASERALDRALLEAEITQQPVRLVHAWTSAIWTAGSGMALMAPVPISEDLRRGAADLLDEALQKGLSRRPSASAVTVTTEASEGDPGRELTRLSADAALLVVGGSGHGQLASALLGSVTSYVLHHAVCPVMVVPDGPPSQGRGRVIVGVDGSPSSQLAFAWALAAADRLGWPLVALHAWMMANVEVQVPDSEPRVRSTFEKAIGDWLTEEVARGMDGHAGTEVTQLLPYGPVAGALLDEAGPDDLLVLGSRGQGGFKRLLLGSVASQCAAHAHGSVVVVKRPSA